MHCTPKSVTELSERMAACMKQVTEQVGEAAVAEGWTLAELETQGLEQLHRVGNELLAQRAPRLCGLAVPAYPAPTVACGCGGEAIYQRQRVGQSKTLLGVIEVRRPYYLCRACHPGRYPVDERLGFCAGGSSAGLQAMMALLGVQFPFEEAATMLAKLTLVQVSPNACRQATEALGAQVAAEEEAAVAAAWANPAQLPPTGSEVIRGDGYLSMDGVTVHLAEQGWKNLWLGAIYTTQPTRSTQRPETLEVRTQQPSFVADLASVESFGRQLWLEAYRRGVAHAQQLIVIGDGAHWLWKLAEEHFPQAVQILDWYHATSYIWQAADLLFGQGTDFAKHGAKQHLDLLWDGQVQTVLDYLEAHLAHHPAWREVITYLRNNQHRMRYDHFRANGWRGPWYHEQGQGKLEGARGEANPTQRWRELAPPPEMT